jgi:hypothetical protein
MASADEYRQQLKAQDLDRMEISDSTLDEAQKTLADVRNSQKQLRHIKSLINLDMKTIRADYRQKMSTAASTSSTVVSLFGKRKLAGSLRAEEKRRLAGQRDRVLEPHQAVKLMIDECCFRWTLSRYSWRPSSRRQRPAFNPNLTRPPSRAEMGACLCFAAWRRDRKPCLRLRSSAEC